MTPERRMALGAALVLLAGGGMVLRGAWSTGAVLLVVGVALAVLTMTRSR